MSTNSLLELTLFVRDVEASAAFYRAVGAELLSVDEPGRPRHYDGSIGESAVQLFPTGDRTASRVQLGFRVGDISQAAASLEELGVAADVPLPGRLHTFDPDGNRVHLSQLRTARHING